jgi:ATPase subunit of ABC transporter with duplicated ATPase domains
MSNERSNMPTSGTAPGRVSSPGDPVLSVQEVSKDFGAQPVLADVSITIHEGERVGLVGRNGSGKSTLLRIISGLEVPDTGQVTTRQGLRVALLNQQCQFRISQTVGQILSNATASLQARVDEYHRLAESLGHTPHGTSGHERLASAFETLQHHLHVAGAWDLDHEVKRMTVALKLPPRDRTLDSLSGGELRRLDLAATLLTRPDLVLLDEPTNHIDVDSVQWIEDFLMGYPGACILVTHDRYFLERVVTRIAEVSEAHLTAYPGNYEAYLERKAKTDAHAARADRNRLSAIRREIQWIKRGPKARGTKQKARIDRFYEMEAQDGPSREREMAFAIPRPNRLGKRILEAESIGHSYEGRTLFQDFSLLMQKHMRIGVLGPNGCGKTTLLRVLMGEEAPEKGRVIRGDSTEFLYVDQSHEEVNPDMSVLQYVGGGAKEIEVNGRRIHIPSYLAQFLFDQDCVTTVMGRLSGGERNRVDLARKLLRGGNFLILDEPTNDLDLGTLRVLEEAVGAFDGCAIVVSHDRYFLNRLCTHMLVFEGDGAIVTITGDYDDYLVYVKQRADSVVVSSERATRPRMPCPADEKGRRLSWREKKELEGIEDAIHGAEAEVAELEALIQKAGFYEAGHESVQSTLAALDAARGRVERLYTRWSELEEMAGR